MRATERRHLRILSEHLDAELRIVAEVVPMAVLQERLAAGTCPDCGGRMLDVLAGGKYNAVKQPTHRYVCRNLRCNGVR